MLIARNYFRNAEQGISDVDVTITLPGVFKSCKFIYYFSENVSLGEESKTYFNGNKMEVFYEKELRKFCDIFYE